MGHELHTSSFGSAHGFTITSYHRSSLATAATGVSRGRWRSSRASASMQPPPSRGMLCGPDRLGCMAYHRTSAFTSANCGSLGVPWRACRADAPLGRSPGHCQGVRCKAIHIAGFGARQFHSSAIPCRMYNNAVSGRDRAVRWPGPNGSAQFR